MERDLGRLHFDTARDLDLGLAAWLTWFSRTPSAAQLAALIEQLEAARQQQRLAEPAEV